MKTKTAPSLPAGLQLVIALGIATAASGCAMRNTMSGGKGTSVLGGVVTVESESFQPTPATTIMVFCFGTRNYEHIATIAGEK